MSVIFETDELPYALVLAAALFVAGLAVVMMRRQHRRLATGWVPWNGLLFAAIVIAGIMIAHLLGIERR